MRAMIVSLMLLVTAAAMSTAADELTVYGGATVFANPEFGDKALIEFPFSIRRNELRFFQPDSTDSLRLAQVFAQVDLFNEVGLAVDSAVTSFTVRAANGAEAGREGFRIFNKLSLFAPPGFYSARLSVIDALSKSGSETFLGQIEVTPPPGPQLRLSQIQLAHEIRYLGDTATGLNPRLIKSGFHILPNPVRIYRHDDSLLVFYAEVYNLGEPGRYRVSATVLGEDSTVFRDFGGMISSKPGSSVVVVKELPMEKWPSGLYYLRLEAYDLVSNAADTAEVAFRVSTPEELLASLTQRKRPDPYDTLSLEERIQVVTYMLTPDKKASLDLLTDEGKGTFLEQFWRDQDSDPNTPENETRNEMVARYEYCLQRFSTDPEKTDGWLTDRGRILMTYGRWEQIEDVQTPFDEMPFQIWFYFDVREGKYFIFQDEEGYEDYRLVHSNVPSEVYSKEWQQRIDEGEIDVRRW